MKKLRQTADMCERQVSSVATRHDKLKFPYHTNITFTFKLLVVWLFRHTVANYLTHWHILTAVGSPSIPVTAVKSLLVKCHRVRSPNTFILYYTILDLINDVFNG
jgi:hypothetical protein